MKALSRLKLKWSLSEVSVCSMQDHFCLVAEELPPGLNLAELRYKTKLLHVIIPYDSKLLFYF